MNRKIANRTIGALSLVLGLTAVIGFAVNNAWTAVENKAKAAAKKDASTSSDKKSEAAASKGGAASFDAEKTKALANPYANDMAWLSDGDRSKALKDYEDKYVKTYPKEQQQAYSALKTKCAKCHSALRPLYSQFVEPAGKDMPERKKNLEAWRKSSADIFGDKNVWQPEPDIWQRYVKRMMSKPGCDITKDEGKGIWGFLVYDSNQRKTGAKKEEWAAQRRGLLKDFESKFPARYKELYETSSAKTPAKQGP